MSLTGKKGWNSLTSKNNQLKVWFAITNPVWFLRVSDVFYTGINQYL